MPRYTQGMMDVGATVCLPKNPACKQCPVQAQCLAYAQGNPQRYPVKTRKLKRSSQSVYLLWAHTEDGD
ncbi:A/G-specific adenine glycosylase, partial [bacterium]|nr:A/G-specific adenine glycosylase [bacterium]